MVVTGKLTAAVWFGTIACGTRASKAALLLEMETEMREPAGIALTKCAVQLETELGERVVQVH